MIRAPILIAAMLSSLAAYAGPYIHKDSRKTNPMDPDVVARCGMEMRTPNLRYIDDEPMVFSCGGSFKNNSLAILDMSFYILPSERGGDRVEFLIQEKNIDDWVNAGKSNNFDPVKGSELPALAPRAALRRSACGPVARTNVTAIQGVNWHGWVAEETFAKPHKGCVPAKHSTHAYRCIVLSIGNDRMVAEMEGACFLRKREYSLENGFSYDIFMDMIKTLRFTEGQ